VVEWRSGVGRYTTENRHRGGADDDQLLLLVRVQPAHEDVGAHAAVEKEVGDGHVGDVRLQVCAAGGADLQRQVADQAQDDRDVVRGEAPQDVLLAANLPQIEAIGVNVLERAELAAADAAVQFDDFRGVFEEVAAHQLPALG